MSRFGWFIVVAPLLLIGVGPNHRVLAQLRVDPSATQRDRGRIGLLGAIREARDERFQRANPTPAPSAKARANPAPKKAAGPLSPNALGNRVASPQSGFNAAQRLPGPVTGASFVDPVQPRSPANPIANPASTPVRPNRLPYSGEGIVIRLPSDLNAEVHYVVDDVDQLVIRAGEEHRLRLKGKYEIRFSRGITDDQRSLGEAHYLLNEGSYRFAITEQGWDLHREPNAMRLAVPVNQLGTNRLPPSEPSSNRNASDSTPFKSIPIPHVLEESLPAPAPRSDLDTQP